MDKELVGKPEPPKPTREEILEAVCDNIKKEANWNKLRVGILEKTRDSLVKENQKTSMENDRYIEDIRMLSLEKIELQKSVEMLKDDNTELLEANRRREESMKELQMNNSHLKLFVVNLILLLVLNIMNIQPSLDFLVNYH